MPLPASKCNYHSPRALYFQAREEAEEEKEEETVEAEEGRLPLAKGGARGHRALATSLVAIIIIYRAPFLPPSRPRSLSPAIILVRATPRPSAETVFQRAVADAAVVPLCFGKSN